MSNNAINVRPVFRDSNGNPRAYGKVYFYNNKTTTLASIYSDEELTTAQTNPYTLDAYGRISGNVKYSGKLTVKATNADGSDPTSDDDVSTTVGGIAHAQQFEVIATTPTTMTVTIRAGKLLSNSGLVSVAEQTTTTITAPSSNPRIDRIVADYETGVYTIVAGSEAASPTAPAIPAGKYPLAQFQLETSTTTITDAMIVDERISGSINSVSDAQIIDNTFTYGGASAAGIDTYAVSLPLAPSAYAAGQRFQFKADVANTGACTINFNSLGAKSIKTVDGRDPETKYILAGSLVDVEYDGTNFVLLNPSLTVENRTDCTKFGSSALSVPDTSTNKYATAFGSEALQVVSTGLNNTAVGYRAGKGVSTGSGNVIIGANAATTGNFSDNVAIGESALNNVTTSGENVAIGTDSLKNNLTNGGNVSIGYRSLETCDSVGNVGVGYLSGRLTSSGADNVCIGREALESNTTASDNTAIGHDALTLSTGGQNTALGSLAGDAITTGANDTCIGYNAAASSASVSNEITLGNSSIATLRCQVTTITALSDERDKDNILPLDQGLEFIKSLNPVSFDWNMRDGGKVGVKDTGFIAQELQTAQDIHGEIPGLVYDENPERLEAGYAKLLPVLVKAIQDLSREVEELKATR